MKKLLCQLHKQENPLPKPKGCIVPTSVYADKACRYTVHVDKAWGSQFTQIVDAITGETIKPFGSYVTRT